MPGTCCVPNCKGNYNAKEKVRVFRFRDGWEKHIPRRNWVPNKSTVVCERHFHECDIITVDQFPIEDGANVKVPRLKRRLREGAVPSIFPGFPHYYSKRKPIVKKSGDDRRKEVNGRHEQNVRQFLDKDQIGNFTEFTNGLDDELKKSLGNWNYTKREDCVAFYMLCTENIPVITNTVKISGDMKVQVAVGCKKVTAVDLSWILDSSCTLKRWSQLVNILARYKDAPEKPAAVSNENKITQLLHLACTTLNEASLACHDVNEKQLLIKLVTEQLTLANVSTNCRRFSNRFVKLASQLYTKSPSCYRLLQQSFHLILPNPRTLIRLSLTEVAVQPGNPIHDDVMAV